jgi:hypothetical protein
MGQIGPDTKMAGHKSEKATSLLYFTFDAQNMANKIQKSTNAKHELDNTMIYKCQAQMKIMLRKNPITEISAVRSQSNRIQSDCNKTFPLRLVAMAPRSE